MVDFQERETRRDLEDADGDGEPPDGPADQGPAASPGGDGGTGADGEEQIDRIREELEERPRTDGATEGPPEGGDGRDATGEHQDTGGGDDHAGGDDRTGGDDHDHHHHDVDTLGAAVVTVSSSRTLADDPSGEHIVEALVEAGHEVVTRELIPDDYDDIQQVVDALVARGDVDVVVSTGGTGVTPDDRTIEAVRPLFDKELPGFGELFRRRSEAQIGTRVVATRATAGVADGVPVFCLPGSRDAVELGVDEIIVEEAPHLAGLAQRDEGEDAGGSDASADESAEPGGDATEVGGESRPSGEDEASATFGGDGAVDDDSDGKPGLAGDENGTEPDDDEFF